MNKIFVANFPKKKGGERNHIAVIVHIHCVVFFCFFFFCFLINFYHKMHVQ